MEKSPPITEESPPTLFGAELVPQDPTVTVSCVPFAILFPVAVRSPPAPPPPHAGPVERPPPPATIK